ncbi:class I lanthipeptide [Taibaiella chishuiensis]|uniref:Uncharacterized protein n=1 Tax=Taibaiella chishuiensis TaxID=1434707 RepID=A0A2P8CZL3_9BACT|nr:class I lanthipeptide [Taibaiella chishuiensis]PSK90409.1 hypothetical protein B0I18_108139 [Taibaiella chishuiensis]
MKKKNVPGKKLRLEKWTVSSLNSIKIKGGRNLPGANEQSVEDSLCGLCSYWKHCNSLLQ